MNEKIQHVHIKRGGGPDTAGVIGCFAVVILIILFAGGSCITGQVFDRLERLEKAKQVDKEKPR